MNRNFITKKIDDYHDNLQDSPRNYIGASIIGSECLRQIWYEFKSVKAEKVPAKTRKTWGIGKRLEGLVLGWIEDAGIDIYLLPATLFSSVVPVFCGHVDAIGRINNKKYILEIKTAKGASFNIFTNKGLKAWNHQYYAQIQSYMGMSGIYSAYILVLNKDNSALSDELIEFDPLFYSNLECKAQMIAHAVTAPPKINGSPLFYKCKMCKFNKVCHD